MGNVHWWRDTVCLKLNYEQNYNCVSHITLNKLFILKNKGHQHYLSGIGPAVTKKSSIISEQYGWHSPRYSFKHGLNQESNVNLRNLFFLTNVSLAKQMGIVPWRHWCSFVIRWLVPWSLSFCVWSREFFLISVMTFSSIFQSVWKPTRRDSIVCFENTLVSFNIYRMLQAQ